MTDGDAQLGRNRYAFLDIGEGVAVIYDRDNHRAWVQSDVAVSTDDWQ